MTVLCEEPRAPYEGEFVPLDGKVSISAQRVTPRSKVSLCALWMSSEMAMIRSSSPLCEGELLELEMPLKKGAVRIRARVTDSGKTPSGVVATLELATPSRHRDSLELFLQSRRAG